MTNDQHDRLCLRLMSSILFATAKDSSYSAQQAVVSAATLMRLADAHYWNSRPLTSDEMDARDGGPEDGLMWEDDLPSEIERRRVDREFSGPERRLPE